MRSDTIERNSHLNINFIKVTNFPCLSTVFKFSKTQSYMAFPLFNYKQNLIYYTFIAKSKYFNNSYINMEKQQNNIYSTIKKLKCTYHSQPISLACIQKHCKVKDRLFCLQCNDQVQFTQNTHVLVSLKKFNEVFLKYRDSLANDQKFIAQQKIKNIKTSIKNTLDQLENYIENEQKYLLVEGQQQQIIRGRLQTLLQNTFWEDIFKMQNQKKDQATIRQFLNLQLKKKNAKYFQVLDNLQMDLLNQVTNAINCLRGVQPPKNKFSINKKNSKLEVFYNQLKVKNTSQYGHYFCQLENDFDVTNSSYNFLIEKMDPQSSIWFGFTFPYVSQQYKWTNIYDQKKGSYCIALFQNGKQINFWSNDKSQCEKIKFDQIKQSTTIQLMIDFHQKQLNFNWVNDNKVKSIKKVKPQKWEGKIYPVVGFYGQKSIIQIV